MMDTQEISSHPEQVGIARLVSKARQEGTRDSFPGKRRWARYSLGMPLHVTTDPNDSSATWPAMMHNISGGGFGFWSKKRVCVGTPIYVRPHDDAGDETWLTGRVAHCVVGIRGFLIGASFDFPVNDPKSSEQTPRAADDATPNAAEQNDRRTIPQTSLRAKCALACAMAGVVGTGLALAIGQRVWPEGWHYWASLLFVSSATTFVLAWMGISLIVRREVRFIEGFQDAINEMARSTADPIQISPAWSTELDPLRHSLLKLRTAWMKRRDADLQHRHKLEEINQIKSNILSIVSHDLRTPMTSILLYAKMLEEELESLSEEDQRHFLKIISEECTRLSRLVDDLLEVQRLESGRAQWDVRPHDLAETIRGCARVFEAMALSKSMELTVDCPDSLPLVETDSDKISQVLSNLLSNAIKYTPNGGQVHLSASASSNEIILRVADSGPGIPREKWDQIFDRFAQLSNPNVREISGVGLGLYIVRQIVERHGGMVWVDSQEGHGSEFFVSLPTRSSLPETDHRPDQAAWAGRVVVGDADPQLASMIAQVLRQENYDVRLAHSGCRLLAHLDRGDVDVVVTDVLMPDMSATELLDALGKIDPRPFRLIVHSYAGDGPDLRRRGVDIVLQRPATENELRQAVALSMQSSSSAGMGVVLVRAPSLGMRRLKELLAGAGHTPIVAESLARAADVIRDYPVQVVILSSDSLQNNWSSLQKLGLENDKNVRVLVLQERIRKRERHLADAYGVTALAYLPGDEAQVLAAITNTRDSTVPEYAS